MGREISELLALYDRRLSIARRENEFLRARQIRFAAEAEVLFRAVVGPEFERLETQIKGAGHQVWIRQSFSLAGATTFSGTIGPSIVLDLRLAGVEVDNNAHDRPIQSFGFRADLERAIIVNYSNTDSGRNGRAGSAFGAIAVEQITPHHVQKVFTAWFAQLVDTVLS